eukprot:TRINITY_DN1450_c0_g3_i1.p1 TRINITY_DN1450_c0_g3~~TRINITY_DN1450_c0_g3_i1.p1  ORF type:complete len:258 (+),score=63.44 TRINITY_DN1450_c0_g3_i1:154-927(+)
MQLGGFAPPERGALTPLPVPARGLSSCELGRGFVNGPVARLIRHLLRLPQDDPQLMLVAAAAVLVVYKGRSASGWSTEEMDFQRAELKRFEAAWRSFLAVGPTEVDRLLSSAALHLAYCEMEASVRDGAQLPSHEQLLVRVAKALLGQPFASRADVEAVVGGLLAEDRAGLASIAEETISRLVAGQGQCGSAAAAGVGGGASRVAALVGSMLAVREALPRNIGASEAIPPEPAPPRGRSQRDSAAAASAFSACPRLF